MAESTAKVEALESFPTLKPAFRLKTSFEEKHLCGDIATGETLIAVACLDGATLESVGDFEPRCNFTIRHSVDYFTIDANKTHGRVDARGTLIDADGRAVEIINEGFTRVNDVTLPLIQSEPGAKTAPFGHGIEFVKFRTGHEMYRELENKLFVASLRFTYIDGVKTGIEQRISEVISGTGME